MSQSRRNRFFFLLCFLAYYITYLGRLNYSASLAGIVQAEGIAKGQAGLIGTAFFVSYGLGQLASGFLGDRINCKILVFSGLFVSGLMNLMMGFLHNPIIMAVVWCVNGLAQSMVWSPLLRLICSYLRGKARDKSCVYINYSVPAGTVSAYALTALILSASGWRTAFFVPSLLLIGMAFLWLIGMGRLERNMSAVDAINAEGAPDEAARNVTDEAGDGTLVAASAVTQARRIDSTDSIGSAANAASAGSSDSPGSAGSTGSADNGDLDAAAVPDAKNGSVAVRSRHWFPAGLAVLALALAAQGTLKDGVTTWIPTYLGENYGTGIVQSVFSTIAIPICNLFGVALASFLLKRRKGNEISAAMISFTVCFLSLCGLYAFGTRGMAVALAFFAIATTCMMSVNTLLIALLPVHFSSIGKVSTVSGILNSCVYAGGAISTYGIGVLSESFGWGVTVFCWMAAAALSAIICAATSRWWASYCGS